MKLNMCISFAVDETFISLSPWTMSSVSFGVNLLNNSSVTSFAAQGTEWMADR